MKTERLLLVGVALFVSACGAGRRAPAVVPPHQVEAGRLGVTRFVAYGDSITEGFLQNCPGLPTPTSSLAPVEPAASGVRNTAPSGLSYPARLQELLKRRYPNQPIEVVNEGVGGEEIEAGAAQLSRTLIGDGPDVLLLVEGVNSLNQRNAEGITEVVDALRSMIREAKRRGIIVIVGTILPERAGGCRSYDYLDKIDDIVSANVQIRTMVGDEGAILVDLYEAFNGRTATLIGPDGLHPSAEGYAVIAEAFFDAITRQLED